MLKSPEERKLSDVAAGCHNRGVNVCMCRNTRKLERETQAKLRMTTGKKEAREKKNTVP